MKKIRIYTDGSSRGNPSEHCGCGWAIIIENTVKNSGNEYVPNATNNIAEMTGVLRGLEEIDKLLKEENSFEMKDIKVYSDSAYIVNGMNQKWYRKWRRNNWKTAKGTDVKNKELWIKIIDLAKFHDVGFVKVKGHNGNKYNELVDSLAKAASATEGIE